MTTLSACTLVLAALIGACAVHATPVQEDLGTCGSPLCVDDESLHLAQLRAQKRETTGSFSHMRISDHLGDWILHYKIVGFNSRVNKHHKGTNNEFTRTGRIAGCNTGCLQKSNAEDWVAEGLWCEGSVTGTDPKFKVGFDAWEHANNGEGDGCKYDWDHDDHRMMVEETIKKERIREIGVWHEHMLGVPERGHTMKFMYKLEPIFTTTTTTNVALLSTCTIYGDPHIVGFDSSPVKAFSLLSLESALDEAAFSSDSTAEQESSDVGSKKKKNWGDFWLVKGADIQIQGRFNNATYDARQRTFLKGLAVGGRFLGGNVLTIGSDTGRALWNDNDIFGSAPSTFQNKFVSGRYYQGIKLVQDPFRTAQEPGYDMNLPMGVKLTVNRGKNGLGVKISMRPQQGGQDGQCGNYNGNGGDDSVELISDRFDPEVATDEVLFRHAFAQVD